MRQLKQIFSAASRCVVSLTFTKTCWILALPKKELNPFLAVLVSWLRSFLDPCRPDQSALFELLILISAQISSSDSDWFSLHAKFVKEEPKIWFLGHPVPYMKKVFCGYTKHRKWYIYYINQYQICVIYSSSSCKPLFCIWEISGTFFFLNTKISIDIGQLFFLSKLSFLCCMETLVYKRLRGRRTDPVCSRI